MNYSNQTHILNYFVNLMALKKKKKKKKKIFVKKASFSGKETVSCLPYLAAKLTVSVSEELHHCNLHYS